MTTSFEAYVLLGIILALIIAAVAPLLMITSPDEIPTCPEDTVLVGSGDFENGRWTYYECGPALDDLGG